jgi:hypothetical protein
VLVWALEYVTSGSVDARQGARSRTFGYHFNGWILSQYAVDVASFPACPSADGSELLAAIFLDGAPSFSDRPIANSFFFRTSQLAGMDLYSGLPSSTDH